MHGGGVRGITRVIIPAYGGAMPSCINRYGYGDHESLLLLFSTYHGLKPQRKPETQQRPCEPWNEKEMTMATRMKRRSRVSEIIARLLDRQSGDIAPGRPSGHGPSGMNQQPRFRWSDNSASVVGSARHIQEKLAAYQARGWGQQETGRSAGEFELALRSGETANQEARNTGVPTSRPRSSRSTWADKWQR
jgi:hypothetical protein